MDDAVPADADMDIPIRKIRAAGLPLGDDAIDQRQRELKRYFGLL